MPENDIISVEKKGNVKIIRIGKGDSLNPLDIDLLERITGEICSGEEVKIITGSDRAFSAGANIRNFDGMNGEKAHEFSMKGNMLFNRIAGSETPVIAAIKGYSLGGGMELALSCDLRVVSPEAKLGLTEINLGILPGWGGIKRMRALIGEEKTAYLVMTGTILTGKEAYGMGLASFMDDDPLRKAMELAEEISKKSYNSLMLIKKLLRHSYDPGDESTAFGKAFDHRDSKEGIESFLQKRKPNFRN